MKVLEKEIKAKYGKSISKKIFTYHLPLGINALEKYKYTNKIMDKMLGITGIYCIHIEYITGKKFPEK